MIRTDRDHHDDTGARDLPDHPDAVVAVPVQLGQSVHPPGPQDFQDLPHPNSGFGHRIPEVGLVHADIEAVHRKGANVFRQAFG
ncbi:MAG: hypothetical protein OXI22_08225 [Defluviicoccus sp.]|nr:hypothetical protein [Defluviicoccus sp.]MDE0383853.1 hypothetical protein [Defluviicoccus sp.]